MRSTPKVYLKNYKKLFKKGKEMEISKKHCGIGNKEKSIVKTYLMYSFREQFQKD